MRHWTYWKFKRFGITLTTRWGWDDAYSKYRQWTPYQTLLSFGRLRLHCFHRGDGDGDPHDHMWDFWTFPLTSYVEKVWVPEEGQSRVQGGNVIVESGRFHKRKAEHIHLVKHRALRAGRIWTIVWTGPKRREWGFWTGGDLIEEYDTPTMRYVYSVRPWKFVPWKEYVDGR